jgi:hypothetical protein
MQDYFNQTVVRDLFQKIWTFYTGINVVKNNFTLSDCEKMATEIGNTTGYIISARSYFNLYKDGAAKNDSSLEAICAFLLLKNDLIQSKDLEFRIIDTKVKNNEVSQKPPIGIYSVMYFKHFLQVNITENTVGESTVKPFVQPINKIHNRKLYLFIILSLLLLIVIFFGGNWYQKRYFSNTEIKEFTALIRNANDAELHAYQKLPQIDTAKLGDYFIQKGMAKGLIISTVKRMAKNNLVLVKAPSSYRILNIECKLKTDTSVMVETHEYWYLRWSNRFTNMDTLLYDVENIQLYQFLREDDKWKIDLNKYVGKSKKLGK